jgi:uncharacterized membrane protein (UPF0127 family)
VQIRHDGDGAIRTLATEVEVADTLLSQAIGLMFRSSFPEGAALVMPFGEVKTRGLHSLFVFVPFDAIWVRDGAVTKTARFEPFRTIARAPADVVVELPAGGADNVSVGDTISLVDSPEG